MAAHSRGPRDRLVASLRGIFGDRLRSVVAYSLDRTESLSCLALVGSLTTADLEACAARAHGWQREGIATPLILPEEEFLRSLDAFPLGRACETQIKSHLVHLREGFIEAGGTPRPIADLVTASAPAFGALLRNIAQLNGSTASDRAASTRDGARAAQIPDGVVTDILALEQPSALKSTDAARLFPEYLAAVEQLARYVDSWNV